MNNLDRQLKRIEKIRNEARHTVEYMVESAKIDYSEQISERLETLGLTRAELADRMGVSAPYITKLLRGTANLTLDSMVKIANALECDFASEARPRERSASARNPKQQRRTLSKVKRPRPAMVHETPASYGKRKKTTKSKPKSPLHNS